MMSISKQGRRLSPQLRHIRSSHTQTTSLDAKWRERWNTGFPSKAQNEKSEPFYMLTMFPYPSGMLHMGHLRVFTINDTVARFHHMRGDFLVNPMGWDSFGLPAENAAIQNNVSPRKWTRENISKMKQQIDTMHTIFDWLRELSTCEPAYYHFTQQLFLWLYKAGFAYKKKSEINWDPVDQTVLANEQVDAKGRSWRSGAIVEKRMLEQWFLKITEFAEDLHKDLDLLKEWPDAVKSMQKNWIGRSEGAEIVFKGSNNDDIVVFTLRPETLFSVQFLAISLDHKLAQERAKTDANLSGFILEEKEKAKSGGFDFVPSKKGYKLENISFTHPLTGKDVPVFVAPYVLSGYGSGAVMGCPAHDQRDWDFWKENGQGDALFTLQSENMKKDAPFTEKAGVLNDSVPQAYAGLSASEASMKMVQDLDTKGLGHKQINYKLRDWLILRQRYWGCPIPIVYCGSCGIVPVPEQDLPVRLPEDIQFSGKGNPLDLHEGFKKCTCPKCKGPATRETDTMDTFMDSSWYFFRYLDAKNSKEPFSKEIADKLMPAKLYTGGIEHAILHLLYSRFISKFLAKIGKWSGGELNGEPFKKLVSQGMVHGKTFVEPGSGRFLKPNEVDTSGPTPKIIDTGAEPLVSYEKMSKSKFNGVDPVKFIAKYGADSTRAHMLFQAPVELILYWDEQKISGVIRWLKKVENLGELVANLLGNHNVQTVDDFNNKVLDYLLGKDKWSSAEIELYNTTQEYVKATTVAFDETLTLNTVISDYMKLTNTIQSASKNGSLDPMVLYSCFYRLLVIMAPVCPAICEEIWEGIQAKLGVNWESIFAQRWPEPLEIKENNTKEFMVMVDGKFKFYHTADVDFLKGKTGPQVLNEMIKNTASPEQLEYLKGKKVILNEKRGCIIFLSQKK